MRKPCRSANLNFQRELIFTILLDLSANRQSIAMTSVMCVQIHHSKHHATCKHSLKSSSALGNIAPITEPMLAIL